MTWGWAGKRLAWVLVQWQLHQHPDSDGLLELEESGDNDSCALQAACKKTKHFQELRITVLVLLIGCHPGHLLLARRIRICASLLWHAMTMVVA